MKHLIFLTASFILLNCSTQRQDNKMDTTKESKVKIVSSTESLKSDSNFHSFLVKFSTNEEFQLTRIDFPFNAKILDIEDNEKNIIITKDEWHHENLIDTSNIETREFDSYSQSLELNDSTATIELRGIDNGIRVDYNFQLRNGRWYLTNLFDGST